MDPCQHPCLQMLPMIFLKAIKGIAGQVDAFLGKFISKGSWTSTEMALDVQTTNFSKSVF